MEDKIKKIEAYCKEKTYISVPEVQQEFNISYREARQHIEELVNKEVLEYHEGLIYVYPYADLIDDGEDEDDEEEDEEEDEDDDDKGFVSYEDKEEHFLICKRKNVLQDDEDDIFKKLYKQFEEEISEAHTEEKKNADEDEEDEVFKQLRKHLKADTSGVDTKEEEDADDEIDEIFKKLCKQLKIETSEDGTDENEDENRGDISEDSEEEFDADEDDFEGYTDDSQVPENEKKRWGIINGLSNGFGVAKRGNDFVVCLDICYPDDSPYKIVLKKTDDNHIYYSDSGYTISYLKENLDTTQTKFKDKVRNIIWKYCIELVDDELLIEIENTERSILALIFFIAAIEQLLIMVVEDSMHEHFDNFDIICINRSKELLANDRDVDRKGLINKIQEKLNEAKATDNVSDIEIYSHILEGYKAISDEYFITIKEEYLNLIDSED